MIYLIPALISFTLGLLILKACLKDRLPGWLLSAALSMTIGLGASGLLTFTSFVLFNRLVPWFVILLNLAVTGALAVTSIRGHVPNSKDEFGTCPRVWYMRVFGDTYQIQKANLVHVPVIFALGIITLGMFTFASLYPYGGWDAWGIWNTKARFLFLGADAWTNMFDPVLWRNQILYPFLLPLINVWFWCFGPTPTYAVPMAMTCLIPCLTAGLLYSALESFTGKKYMILVPLWIFTNMFTLQLAASQYTDLLIGLLLLAAITCFLLFQKTREQGYLILMGIALGMISFTKVEGVALCLITLAAAVLLIRQRTAAVLIAATVIAAIPLIVFTAKYAPQNSGIFINGLASADHPASFGRLARILAYYGREFISIKWSGLWIVLTMLLIIAGKKSLRPGLRIIPLVLGCYVLVFTATYAINTFYEITWWLDTSLNRIIFAMIPITALWAFLAIDEK